MRPASTATMRPIPRCPLPPRPRTARSPGRCLHVRAHRQWQWVHQAKIVAPNADTRPLQQLAWHGSSGDGESCSAPACPTRRRRGASFLRLLTTRCQQRAFMMPRALRWGARSLSAPVCRFGAPPNVDSDMGRATCFQRGAELHLKCMNAAFHPLKPVPKVDGDTARSVDCAQPEGTPCARAAGPLRPLLATVLDLRTSSRKERHLHEHA